MLFGFGCDNGNVENVMPGQSYSINGTIHEIVEAGVYYNGQNRYVAFWDKDRYGVVITVINQGDPSVTANQIPIGNWTTFDVASFTAIRIDQNPISTTYTSSDSVSNASLVINGIQGASMTVDASFTFTSGSIESLKVKYTGIYTWSPD
jgi:hypothetical protein